MSALTPDNDASAQLERLPLKECAVALTLVLAAFAAWAWLQAAGMWSFLAGGFDPSALAPMAPGFIVLAALSFVVQMASNIAAAAARHAIYLADGGNEAIRNDVVRAQALMFIGGCYNAWSLHHALSIIGLVDGSWQGEAGAWVIALVLAFYEPAQWWVDSSLRVALAEVEAKEESKRRRAYSAPRPVEAASGQGEAQPRQRAQQAPPQPQSQQSAVGGKAAEIARVAQLHARYKHEDGWRIRIAREMGISVRTVTRHLSRARGAPILSRETEAEASATAAIAS